jgi:hypothetical protein
MRWSILAALIAVALSALGAQVAFAWPDDTTASLSTTPTDIDAGQPWVVDISFVSNGSILKADSIKPVVTIRNVQTGETQRFQSAPTAVTGVYEATVVFPSAGTWSYSVAAFSRSGPSFDYPPVVIGPAPAPVPVTSEPVSGPAIVLGLVVALAVAVALASLLVRRRTTALAPGR